MNDIICTRLYGARLHQVWPSFFESFILLGYVPVAQTGRSPATVKNRVWG